MRALTHTGEPKDALAPSWYLSAADDDNVTPDMTGLRGHWWAEGKPCYTGPAARTLVCTVAHSHVCIQAHSQRAPCVQARSQDSTPHKTRSVTPRPVRRAQGVSVTSRATFALFGDFFCDKIGSLLKIVIFEEQSDKWTCKGHIRRWWWSYVKAGENQRKAGRISASEERKSLS